MLVVRICILPAVVHSHNVHEQNVFTSLVQAGDLHFKWREHSPGQTPQQKLNSFEYDW